MSSLVLLLLLCLSIHACNARHMGVIDKETSKNVHLFSKELEKVKLHKTSIPSRLRPSILEELQTQQELVGNGEIKTLESWDGANKQKDSKVPLKEKEDAKGATSGNENILGSSSQVGLQQATKLEGWKRPARSMLGSAPHDTEETVDSKENDVVEDIVVMDYAQPHRKPPIHNK